MHEETTELAMGRHDSFLPLLHWIPCAAAANFPRALWLPPFPRTSLLRSGSFRPTSPHPAHYSGPPAHRRSMPASHATARDRTASPCRLPPSCFVPSPRSSVLLLLGPRGNHASLDSQVSGDLVRVLERLPVVPRVECRLQQPARCRRRCH